jgi:chromosome segregation ATPase
MSQIEILNKMLREMDNELNSLNQFIKDKEELINHIILRIEELNSNLSKENEILSDSLKKRDRLSELKSEVETNYKQIDEGVNTLVDILRTKKLM